MKQTPLQSILSLQLPIAGRWALSELHIGRGTDEATETDTGKAGAWLLRYSNLRLLVLQIKIKSIILT